MSKFYAAGLRRLADALESAPITGDKYPEQAVTIQVNVGHHYDVIEAAARFDAPVAVHTGGGWCATVDFDGVELIIYSAGKR